MSITIVRTSKECTLEECFLSLFGKFLTTIPFNRRAARDNMRMVWRMGSNLKILEVGDDILQFIFPIEFQMQWVLNNEPWSFKNHLLLLRRWERGLRTRKMSFTHSVFWVQVWGLPFELVSEQVGMDIGNDIGRFILGDDHKGSRDQARYLRIRVDIPRGGESMDKLQI